MTFLTRLFNRITAWIDRQTEDLLAAAASDEPAVDDALDQLDFHPTCSAGKTGLIRMEPPCQHTAIFAVTVHGGPGTSHAETWCGCCLAMYQAMIQAARIPVDLHAERL